MMCLLLIFLCSTCRIATSTSAPSTVPYFPTWQSSSNSLTSSSSLLKEGDQVPLHRVVIIDALNRRQATDVRLQTQFHKKLTSELLKNATDPMDPTELALWISAIIATKENPRNYNSLDLVADLLQRVRSMTEIHPFLILTLCNAHALLPEHLSMLTDLAYVNTSTLMLAQSLKTLACARTLKNAVFQRPRFEVAMENIAATLAAKQTKDGHFGDMYTTSLAIQALTAYGKQLWRENAALEVMQKEEEVMQKEESETGHTNIIKAYYLTRAVNARRVNFLKDLYHGSYDPERKVKQMYIYVHLSIRYENSDVEFGLTVRVPNNWSLLQIMKRAAELSENFRFSYSKFSTETVLFEVNATPNDPEKNLFWLICSKRRNEEGYDLDNLFPFNDEQITLWYRTEKCPPMDD